MQDTVKQHRRLWRALLCKGCCIPTMRLRAAERSSHLPTSQCLSWSSLKHHMYARAGVDHGREPCPYRILGDIGGAFGMGAVGGGIWHLVKGTKNSPSGARLRGGLEVRCTCLHVPHRFLDICEMAVRGGNDSSRGTASKEPTS